MVHFNVVPNSWLVHAYSWGAQTGTVVEVVVTLRVGEMGVLEVEGLREGGVG